MGPNQKYAMISQCEANPPPQNPYLDLSCTKYINNFEMFLRKLTKLGDIWYDKKVIKNFKQTVEDPDYDTEVTTKYGNVLRFDQDSKESIIGS